MKTLALNVDPEHHSDHIPYSDATLNMYQRNSTWAATQEKQLRLFAADQDEKRLRFKPMPRNQRAFIHSLAEDFGMDSESMDPEPHRHVAIFKTPKFVMAPMRALAECTRTRQAQERLAHVSASVASSSVSTLRSKPNNVNADPYNAFLVVNPRFALTIEELSAITKGVLATTSFRCELEITFLPSEAVALKPSLAARLSIPDSDMQTMLESIQAPLSKAFTAQSIGKIQLARLDSSLNILRKESDAGPGSGWSQVAASKGVPLRQVQKNTPFGNKGGFAVLSLSSRKKKNNEVPVEVAEDWEVAEEQEEQKERISGVNSGVTSEDEGAARGLSDGSKTVASTSASASGVETGHGSAALAEGPLTIKPLYGRWADLDDDDRAKITLAKTATFPSTTDNITTVTMPKEVKQKSGLIIGLNAGHKVTPRTPAPRISRRKGFLSKRTAFVREITKEVAGLAPYEKRIIELLRNSKDKRARRLAKKRLGTFGRSKRKVDEMTKVIAESRRAGH
ncbi:nf-x1 type zinc finger [Pyrenophora seminiperda CCB06]|uniref:60S ribosomal protein L36 n=5 Tax=Pyrenophora TaxID=5027 RepID=A0A3M7MI35_9PLEO|nr:nf-x1 type zinc finger [Pyrenophora seminiperda CCB06]